MLASLIGKSSTGLWERSKHLPIDTYHSRYTDISSVTCTSAFVSNECERTLTPGHSLSFYKEELAGETSNYVHLRAAAEQVSPWEVLRDLTEEVLDTARRIDKIISKDTELRVLWNRYLQVGPDGMVSGLQGGSLTASVTVLP